MTGRPLLALGLAASGLLAGAPPAPAASARVRVELAPREVTVGDRVTVEIGVETPPDVAPPHLPEPFSTWGDAEVLAVTALPAEPGADGTLAHRFRVTVAAFRPGEVALPPLQLGGDGVDAATPADLGFTVRSVLPPPGTEVAPEPALPPRPLSLGERFWWTAGGLAGCCLLAGALLLRRRLLAPDAVGPPQTPLARLLVELDALADGPPEAAHVGLSLSLRRFIADVVPVAALERTTSEIHRELSGSPLDPDDRRAIVGLLRACDAVKFARRPAGHDETAERLASARGIGERVVQRLEALRAAATEREDAA